VLRVVLFERGAGGQLVLVVVHHLAVDAVSWRILLEDLAVAYGQAARGVAAVLPAKTTSFPAWSRRLGELAVSAEVAGEAGYWRRAAAGGGVLPRDRRGVNTAASARVVRAGLDAARTGQLLREVPAAYRTQVNDVLLTALGMVVTRWARCPAVVADVEGHGREDTGADMDVSRTVGWFTSIYPVLLGGLAGGDPGAALRRMKEYLRAIPRHGLGYGLLRYLARALPGVPGAEISFNYLGQASQAAQAIQDSQASQPGAGGGGTGFRRVAGSLGQPAARQGERSYLIEVNGQVGADGCLEFGWTFSTQVHDEATITTLARDYIAALDQLIGHCTAPGAGALTPSDFPLAGLDQASLDAIEQRFGAPAGGAGDPGGRS
jgi:non-ribosomal peptide synthase protein (TIGR01720 family)